ncbi:MAG: hypothetical protein KAJ42_18680 [Gemmatimonadetes bacterium]|nr:hypothetical protein [Gemmatimonadota bacterium]
MSPLLAFLVAVVATDATAAPPVAVPPAKANAPGIYTAATQVAVADTFRDNTARELVLRAASRSADAAEGLASYETTMTERMRVGAQFGTRLPIRARTLYHRERVARARWSREEDWVIRWIGRREGQPVFRDLPFGIELDFAELLDLDSFAQQRLFDPTGDRIDFFEAGWILPVSTTGLGLYRFSSGDTLRIGLPPPHRSLTLVEVVVEPRARSWETVEGSLWFDAETGDLTRAIFRPSDVWNHEEQEPGDLEDVPFLLKPGIGTVKVVIIEYALFEGRWWLPWRLAATGVYEWGHGLVRWPLEIEWSMRDFTLNEVPGEEVSADPDLGSLASISIRRRNTGSPRTVYLTPRGDLSQAPELPPPLGEEPLDFTGEELRPLLDRFEQVAGVEPLGPAPSLLREALTGLRYNRIQGLNVGGARSWLLADETVRLDVDARVGLADLEPEAEVGLGRGRWKVTAYRELADAGGLGDPFGLGNSIDALLLGHDDGEYFWRTGGGIGVTWGNRTRSLSLNAFGERQGPATVHAQYSLAGDLRPNIAAEEIDAFGVAWDARAQGGDDPREGVVTGRVWGEAAGGGQPYWRALGSTSVVRGIGGHLSAAASAGLGVAALGAPVQRWLFVGGTPSLRGFEGGSFQGTGAYFVRAEIGTRGEAIRGVLLADAGWAGPRDEIFDQGPGASVGAGLSLMDGLLRLDLARGVRKGHDWRAHFYLDGLF